MGRELFPHTQDYVVRVLVRTGLELEAPFADSTAGRGRRAGAGKHHEMQRSLVLSLLHAEQIPTGWLLLPPAVESGLNGELLIPRRFPPWGGRRPPADIMTRRWPLVLSAEIKQRLKRVIVVVLASALGVTALAYAVDYAVFRYKVATNRQPYGQIAVMSYDAIPQKSGRTQFIFHPPEPQTCANSLFPHAGYVPCWYLQRHSEQRIDM